MDIAKELSKLGDQYSVLAISSIEALQDNTNSIIKYFTKKEIPGVYVSFNKPYKGIKRLLNSENIPTDKIFFIDCITTSIGESNPEHGVLHIRHPSDLTGMSIAISEFVEQIKAEKFIIIDALATLLIYNTEELVIKFVKSIIEESAKRNMKTIILTPSAKGGDLINKITLFFDKTVNLS